MKAASKILLIIGLVGIISTGCRREECSEIVPEMGYNSFIPSISDSNNQSYDLIFDFTDCDGDFGKNANAEIIDQNGVRQSNNFFIDLYYRENGQWKKYEFGPDDTGFDTNIPVLSDNSASTVLTGELEKTIPLYLYPFDTIKFESRILDNSGHYSNWAETPQFIF